MLSANENFMGLFMMHTLIIGLDNVTSGTQDVYLLFAE